MQAESILAGAWFDALRRRVVEEPIAVRVGEGRIVSVSTGPDAVARQNGEAALRLPRGGVLFPGFVDAHVHLSFVPRDDHEQTIRATLACDGAARRDALVGNAYAALRGGATTVRDCGDVRFCTGEVDWDGLRAQARAPRVLRSGPPVTSPDGHLHWCGGTVDEHTDLAAVTARHREAGATWLKVMASGGQMTRSSDPLSAQFDADRLREIRHHAADAGLRVAAHALNAEAVVRCAAAGVDTVEHALWRDAAGRPDFRPQVADALAARRTAVVWTFGGIARLALGLPGYEALATPSPEGTLEQRVTAMAEQFAAGEMRARGVPLAVASDAGVRGTAFSTFVDALAAAARLAGVGAGEAAALGTIEAARALGLGEEIGSIEAGKHADLLECAVTDRAGDVRFEVGRVWVGGRLVAGHRDAAG